MANKYRFMRYPGGKPKAVTFSYDDAVIYDKRFADILEKYNMKATFNVPSWICKERKDNGHLNFDDIIALYQKGHEIAVHCAHHQAPGLTRSVTVIQEVLENRKFLEDILNTIVRGMAYPDCGITRFVPGAEYSDIRTYLKGLDIAYSRSLAGDNDLFDLPTDWYNWIPTAHHDNPEIFDYIDKFVSFVPKDSYVSDRRSKLFYIWGHTFEFENNNNWDRIESICEKLSNKEDTWYATNIEIHDYVEAYNSLKYSADESRVYNPTATDIWFEIDNKTYLVKSGETIVTD